MLNTIFNFLHKPKSVATDFLKKNNYKIEYRNFGRNLIFVTKILDQDFGIVIFYKKNVAFGINYTLLNKGFNPTSFNLLLDQIKEQFAFLGAPVADNTNHAFRQPYVLFEKNDTAVLIDGEYNPTKQDYLLFITVRNATNKPKQAEENADNQHVRLLSLQNVEFADQRASIDQPFEKAFVGTLGILRGKRFANFLGKLFFLPDNRLIVVYFKGKRQITVGSTIDEAMQALAFDNVLFIANKRKFAFMPQNQADLDQIKDYIYNKLGINDTKYQKLFGVIKGFLIEYNPMQVFCSEPQDFLDKHAECIATHFLAKPDMEYEHFLYLVRYAFNYTTDTQVCEQIAPELYLRANKILSDV